MWYWPYDYKPLYEKYYRQYTVASEQAAFWQAKYFEQKNKPADRLIPEPVTYGFISSTQPIQLFVDRFGLEIVPQLKIKDGTFKVTTVDEVMFGVSLSGVSKMVYEPDFCDCDDYSFALTGWFCLHKGWQSLPFGSVTTFIGAEHHNQNCFVAYEDMTLKKLVLKFIEPQDYRFVEPDKIELVTMP